MTWAGRRRLIIAAVVGVVALIIMGIILFASVYQAPSCKDGVENQGEAGVDCGGPCPYLCVQQAQAPVVRFTQALSPIPGRADVIASVDNPNADSYARSATYQLSLYASDHTLAAPVIKGSIDLPPGKSVPVFIPNISTGNAVVANAFLTITSANWQKGGDTRIVPSVGSPTLGGSINNPRVSATLTNPSTTILSNVKVVAIVYDASGNVLAASQTVIPTIPGQGSASALFTWNAGFGAPVARVDVLPVIPLP